MRPLLIALWNGIVMGGGVGVSIHAPFRIATDKSMFAMPEAKIGFFTDVSGGYFLARLKHNIGLYLGLTSQRLKGKDLVKAGLANYYLPSEKVHELEKRLFDNPNPNSLTRSGIDSMLKEICEKVEGDLDHTADIKRYAQNNFL
jgi:enoyl-CoA hydratase/carnithine racemase